MLDKYLIENYEKIKEISLNVAGVKQYEDLLHFVIEELYKCDQNKINEVIKKNQMEFFIARVMINQFRSETSRYYKKYNLYHKYNVAMLKDEITRSLNNEIQQKKIVEERLNWIEKKLKNLNWFDTQIFKLYYEQSHTLDSLSKATKINRNTIYHSIKKVKKYLKNEK